MIRPRIPPANKRRSVSTTAGAVRAGMGPRPAADFGRLRINLRYSRAACRAGRRPRSPQRSASANLKPRAAKAPAKVAPHPGQHARARNDVIADRGGKQAVADEHHRSWNASALVCSNAASPNTAASRRGTMPSVQPKAATTLACQPRERSAASVKSTPMPGEATTISDVIRSGSWPFGSSSAYPFMVASGCPRGSKQAEGEPGPSSSGKRYGAT
jgi:hypothetical protein